jgi:eukaryotic-like serine/threonine-protein kinase
VEAPELSELAIELEGTPYEPIAQIGQGGMGAVFEVKHRALGTKLVVKFVVSEKRPELEERLRIEAQTLARIAHPRVLSVLDLLRTRSGKLIMVTERLAGHTLKTELVRRARLPANEAIEIACQALDGLQAAHSLGLIHRDVKADNLFLLEGEPIRVKVIDFGIVKLTDADGRVATVLRDIAPLSSPTADGTIVGTPSTIAPEHILGRPVDHRVDIYAMGHVLYRMLTGQFTFRVSKFMDLMNAHVHDVPMPPSQHAPEIPAALDAAILKALAKSPAERFASAEGMAAALRASIANAGSLEARATIDDEPTMIEDELTHQDDSTVADNEKLRGVVG